MNYATKTDDISSEKELVKTYSQDPPNTQLNNQYPFQRTKDFKRR